MSEAKKAMTVDQMLANMALYMDHGQIREDFLLSRELVRNVRRFAQYNGGQSVGDLIDNLKDWENKSKSMKDKTAFENRQRLMSEVETLREDLRSAESKLSALVFVLASSLAVSLCVAFVFFAHYFS